MATFDCPPNPPYHREHFQALPVVHADKPIVSFSYPQRYWTEENQNGCVQLFAHKCVQS